MQRLMDTSRIEPFLNQDWPWAGFALGDLEPDSMTRCEWWRAEGTLVLLFDGLNPRLVCHFGDSSGLAQVLTSIGDERIWANIRPECEDVFRQFYRPEKTVRMVRMFLESPVFRSGEAVRLGPSDGAEIEELLQQGEWVLFLPHTLASGHYYGIRENGRLIAIAGVHLASTTYNIAALGSVFTHPDHRGRGLAAVCCSHVIHSVRSAGIQRVVLNVEEAKAGARRIYERLGFQTACTYLDGVCVRA